MRKIGLFIFIGIILISNISALCNEGQIDINTASLEELDNLYGIGPAKAQAIIDTRPYENLDDLINVKGIGEITLENIKNQNLACVSYEEKKDSVENSEVELKENDENYEEIPEEDFLEIKTDSEPEEIPVEEVIILTPKDIKTKSDNEVKNKISLPFLGLVLFCILIGFLYLIREKRYKKNEFKE